MGTVSEQVTAYELGWLAGIIEGEGSIANYTTRGYYCKKKDCVNNPKIYFDTMLIGIIIVNTDMRILEKVSTIFDKIPVYAYINRKSASVKQNAKSFKFSKPCYEMAVRRRDEVEVLGNLILPYIFGDKKERIVKLLQRLKDNPGKPAWRAETKRKAPLNAERMKR